VCLVVVAAVPPASAGTTGPGGNFYAWGSNSYGQFGNDSTDDSHVPVAVSLPGGVVAAAVSEGASTSLAVGSDGNVYAWGSGDVGQLGDDNTDDSDVPVEVKLPVTATAVSEGDYTSLALGSDGHVYAWGWNASGQLGDDNTDNSDVPVEVSLPVTATAVSEGNGTSLALGSDGIVYAWGDNSHGQLGDDNTDNSDVPVEVSLPVTATAVSEGDGTSLALGSDGLVYGWGSNSNGQLGNIVTTDWDFPVVVRLPAGITATAVSEGSLTSLAVGSDGNVYALGYNHDGQLGDGSTADSHVPVEVSLPAGVTATSVSEGAGTSLAMNAVDYVAMGDSFSSGEGVPPYTPDSVKTCHRSQAAYSALLSQQFGWHSSAFVACSGETSEQFLRTGRPKYGEGPEIDALDGKQDAVTLTIGGNDVGFGTILRSCIQTHVLSFGLMECAHNRTFVDHWRQVMDSEEPQLLEDYQQVLERAGGQASVMVADYPVLFESSNCPDVSTWFGPDDVDWIRQLSTQLDSEVSQAAREAGVNYVEASSTFAGHGLCGTGDPWLNGIGDTNHWYNIFGSFHPNAAGQAGYAQAFTSFIDDWRSAGEPLTPKGLPANPPPVPVAAPATALSATALSAPGTALTAPATTLPVSAGELTVTAPGVPDGSCPDGYIGGEVVTMSADGFAPGASVSLDLSDANAAGAPDQVHLGTVTADSTGQASDTLRLPLGMEGVTPPGGSGMLGYFQATGTGANATSNLDNMLFNVATPASSCGTAGLPFAASATVSLSGNDTPFLPVPGAVFEVSGQGLPGPLDGSPAASPAPHTFAELDTGPGGETVCPAAEPAGVACSNGALQDLYAGATYTVTQLQAPPGYATAPSETFTAPTDGSTGTVPVADSFLVGNFTTGSGAQNCVLCLAAPSAPAALSASGSATVSWSGPATVNSTSATAIVASGSAKLSGGSLFSPGGTQVTGTAAMATQSPPSAGTFSDPFYWFHFPVETGPARALSLSGSATSTASPGTYSRIAVSGNARLTLSPGVYVVTGPLSVSGHAKVSGSGVTIELACPSYPGTCARTAGSSLLGDATLSIEGGAVGPGDGFVLLSPPGTSGNFTAGTRAGLALSGLVYAPGIALAATADATMSVLGAVVAAEATATGNAAVDVTAPGGDGGGT
jgi:alpha-tubulin suppressor-like RCC1 family protein/lysophospholipase L1-like esterase